MFGTSFKAAVVERAALKIVASQRAGDLAEHVVAVAGLKESGDLISDQKLRQQIDELKQQVEQGRKTASNVAVETPHLNRRDTSGDFNALKQELYEKLKVFTGEVGKELKRMNTKLGAVLNPAKGDEMKAYLAHVEALDINSTCLYYYSY
ncbi:hypothetical protein E2P81_ATG00499 [Venturia nashicola]|uniref:Uncharacterized protein n=1 Tax=Venturia nashicola TaxID=86259 RepID=A0A4Z1PE10_9PEZI|nr:hypothetical protein E6O75_ATG00512 [Venturia nashicola]TLD39512.1 hypothetical protein E2P81_ATG00499 [Venturia nashicola]